MITIIQIFQIIENNNFDDLLMIINYDKKFNFNVLNKNGISLLYISIKYRAKECFDLLIKLENLTILNSTSYYINPIHIALDYYINGKNHVNKYYLDKLLEYNVKITITALKKGMNNLELFNTLFFKIKNNLEYQDYCDIMEHICIENKLNILEYIYKTIDESKILNINKILFRYCIQYDNICIINYLEKYNFNFTYVDNNSSLYYALNYYSPSHSQLFDYIYNYYNIKTKEELEIIDNIYVFNFSYNLLLNIINKYLTLNLNFKRIVIILLNKALNYTTIFNKENYENLLIVIFIILKNKNINIIIEDNYLMNNNEKYLTKLLNIIEYFDLNINKLIINKIKSIIINSNYNYEINKKKYLSELNKIYDDLKL